MMYDHMIDITLPDTIRKANISDWRLLADITAEAFADDPVNQWIFGNHRAILSAFRVLMRTIYAPHGICHVIGNDAAAVWTDYSAQDIQDEMGLIGQINFTLGQLHHGSKGSLARAMKAETAMEKHHPTLPHLYLFTIGARQIARGKGLGRTLLRPMLDYADKANLPCYLENSNPINTGFYNTHGFRAIKKFSCGEGAPPLEAMWRDPLKT